MRGHARILVERCWKRRKIMHQKKKHLKPNQVFRIFRINGSIMPQLVSLLTTILLSS